ncbi:uncharacterized protein LOC123561459 isoform X2 [Mercenaria mercenaria]|nr:uncharacterized protein LOC123561459 isoform X2 [Mercenaria mercenaria]
MSPVRTGNSDAFWTTAQVNLNTAITTANINLETDSTSAKVFINRTRSSIYNTDRSIRVLSKETLNNIIVDNEEDCPKRQFLIYKCNKSLCGGWGDREKGIVSSFLLALLTNRTFAIYMNKPCDIENFIEPFIYDWTKCKRFLDTILISNVSEEKHVSGNRRFYHDIPEIDFENLWTLQAVVMYMNAYEPVMSGIKRHKNAKSQMEWILNKTNPEIVHLVLHTLFKPKQRLMEHLTYYIKDITHGRQLVCGHIRKGKNPSIPGDNNLPKGPPKHKTIFSFLKQYKDSTKYVIYIATDSEDVRYDAVSKFRNVVNVNRTIVHVDRLGGSEKTTDVCEGLYTVLFEQQILSLCDKLLLTRSNFGTIAAYMRGVSKDLFLYQTETDKVFQTNLTNIQTVYGFV